MRSVKPMYETLLMYETLHIFLAIQCKLRFRTLTSYAELKRMRRKACRPGGHLNTGGKNATYVRQL